LAVDSSAKLESSQAGFGNQEQQPFALDRPQSDRDRDRLADLLDRDRDSDLLVDWIESIDAVFSDAG
jgi:hypothetical protein